MAIPDALTAMGRIAANAGALAARMYREDLAVETKADKSPVTAADRAANEMILEGLDRDFPHVPVLSEESPAPAYPDRKTWTRFFLVDPLDGTKGFVRKTGDFSVNIALMVEGRPALGAVHWPLEGRLYLGGPGLGAWRQGQGAPEAIRAAAPPPGGPVVAASRSRRTPKLDAYLAERPHTKRLRLGSSLKFCALAEGRAHLYPCLHDTWEWDTAAGEALLLGAGGAVADLEGRPLAYNKPNLLNPPFIARGRGGQPDACG